MRGETGPPADAGPPVTDVASLERGRFTYFPVAPGRLEFALEVRRALLREKPQVVAVEMPVTLEGAWMRAIEQLPEISVIVYPDEDLKSDGEEDHAIYVPVEPADPFTEAVRTAREIGAQVVFADPDSGRRPHLPDTYPDPYAIRHIGGDMHAIVETREDLLPEDHPDARAAGGKRP